MKHIKAIILGILIVSLMGCNFTNSTKPSTISKESTVHYYPKTYDIELAKEKGLISEDLDTLSEYYLEVQGLYRIVLEDKLKRELDLGNFEKKLEELDTYFQPYLGKVDKYEGYQQFTTMDLPYLFLRNNLHIENLSDEDLELLIQKLTIEDPIHDKDLVALVDRTFLSVLQVNQYGDKPTDKDTSIFYNTHWSSCCALEPELEVKRDTIVIEVRVDMQYDENGNVLDGYSEAAKQLEKTIAEFKKQANKQYTVDVLYYWD
ncbi:hypothetical protein M2475_000579 [Breznakia sp. PF5-3]|uniref:hypothetical protein n=1 Tax=unclassified Breznakia TaxID=2623764 RepID=UPI0024049EF7|nr:MULTISPECIES: hypothetical protein [unclassified Breznakia]MDF9824221.1 hypothetical protein [Breznakia sp. PM6-1]MDF9835019.1 hypothetical protein [Breznakia sp. PF5-3]MDF9837264.1 hypothetical protein [Breznakia sp. PFB2-8]MDF9859254.1 hypothetical protein [Breznakia sp. PH5-24]